MRLFGFDVRSLEILSFLFLSALLTGCFKSSPDAALTGGEKKKETHGSYYLINSYPSEESSVPSGSGELLPWTEQRRVADYTSAGDFLYLALNNTGILKIPLDDPYHGKMDLIENDYYLSGNTMKSLFYYKKSIYCHIYRDNFFSGKSGRYSHSPLVKLDSSEGNLVSDFVKSSSLEKYEAVDFIYSGGRWISAWKHTDNNSSSFNYYSHDIRGCNLSGITESEYRKSLSGNNGKKTDVTDLEKILGFIQTVSSPAGISDLSVKYLNCSTAENYRFMNSSDDSDSYLSVPVYKSGSTCWFTFEDRVYKLSEKSVLEKLLLDPLPEGYNYTGVCCERGKLYLFWEYQSFFYSGNSGFSIIDEKGVDKIRI